MQLLHASPQDRYWSARALFVHGIKTAKNFATAARRWTTSIPFANLHLRCYPCTQSGTNRHNGVWRFARAPCDDLPAGSRAAAASEPGALEAQPPPRFCEVDLGARFRCCGWPWTIPEYRTMALDALRDARRRGDGRLSATALAKELRKRQSTDRTVNPRKCVANCLRLPVLTRTQVGTLLTELAERGDVEVEHAAAPPSKKRGRGRAPAGPEIIARVTQP